MSYGGERGFAGVAPKTVFWFTTPFPSTPFCRYWGDGASTQSLVMRSKSGTIRIIGATHTWTKLVSYSAVRWGS